MLRNFDIVIPVGQKDSEIIGEQIKYTKKNIIGYRNIYIITYDDTLKIENCVMISEKMFPFSMKTIEKYLKNLKPRHGWYLQQLLKLYAGIIIPGILEKYLVIDADTFFLKPTTFISNDNKCLYNVGNEYNESYFTHMKRLNEKFVKVYKDKSGICHHMIFETKYLQILFNSVEEIHKKQFYIVFLENIKYGDYTGASEYELYFNFISIFYKNNIKIRNLNWENVNNIENNLNKNYDYISYHWHKR
jgi:hypothetical protein